VGNTKFQFWFKNCDTFSLKKNSDTPGFEASIFDEIPKLEVSYHDNVQHAAMVPLGCICSQNIPSHYKPPLNMDAPRGESLYGMVHLASHIICNGY